MSVFHECWKTIAAGSLIALLPGVVLVAQEDRPAAKATQGKAAETKSDEKKANDKSDDKTKADRFAVPENADAETLLKFVREMQSFRPTSAEEFLEYREKGPQAMLKAATKVMELEKGDKKSKNYLEAQFASLLAKLRLGKLQEGSDEDAKQIVADTAAYLSAKDPKDVNGNDGAIANAVAQQLEFGGRSDLAKEALAQYSEILSKAADENDQLKQVVASMAGVLRRMNLPGNKMEIKGKTVDGKDFDWEAYSKGKVVLVDFWATWCGPCVRELPNVKDNYEKYHAKGFDVVGISLDRSREALEKFLEKEGTKWAQLYEDDAGGGHPVAEYYGIQAIPTVILVDKEGKVVSLNARGPELGKLLEKLLGPADEKKPEEKSDTPRAG
jgi:thiol-disulfide isomerase/thioredoxin